MSALRTFLVSVVALIFFVAYATFASPRTEYVEGPEGARVIVRHEPEVATVLFLAFVASLVLVFYFATKIEKMGEKKAVGVIGVVYGAALMVLMLMRKDFRIAAPLLAPIAAMLLIASIFLLALLRAAGHDVYLEGRGHEGRGRKARKA